MSMRKFFLCIAAFIFIFSACKKGSTPINLSPNFYFYNGGTASFSNSLLLFPTSDTLTVNVVVLSTYSVKKNVTVSLGVTDSSITNYNNAYGSNYQLMPESAYHVSSTQFTMETGALYDTLTVSFYKQNIPKSGNFMVPLTILKAGDEKITADLSTIYFHVIGNCLSGLYKVSGTRANYSGAVSDNVVVSVTDLSEFEAKRVVPIDQTTGKVDYADLINLGWNYLLTYDCNGGDLSVEGNATIYAQVASGSFKILAASYDTVLKVIYIKSTYTNTNGDGRVVEETLTKE